jgi:cell wall-associated NlpC family hydrolase
MVLGEQTSKIRALGGRFRAAAARAATGRRGSVVWALTLALLCGAILLFATPDTASAASPTTGGVRLTGSAKTQVDSLSAQAQALQADIAGLDQQLEQNTEAYNQLHDQLDTLNMNLFDLRDQLASAQSDYQYRLDKYENRLCELYKAGGSDAFLQMVLEAKGASDFLSRARVASDLAQQDRNLLVSLDRSAKRLDNLLVQVDQAKGQELLIRGQMTDRLDEITVALAERQNTLASIGSQINAIVEAERTRQAEEQERMRQALISLLNGGQIYNGTLPETDSEILNQFLQTAAAYINLPYVWGGDRPSTGMDCSGYTQFVYKQHGVKLPHYSGYQAQMGIPVGYEDIRAGDLLAFGFPVHHVGIYIGEDLFIHAAGTGDTIHISRLSARSDLAAIRRFDLKPRTGPPAYY